MGQQLTTLVDSVIVIDHFNGLFQATDFLRNSAEHLALSVITRAEVLAGFDAVDIPQARLVLDAFVTLPVDTPISDAAAQLRREHRWKLPDALQAAIAVRHGLALVTRNTRDFPPDRFPFVKVLYEL